MVIHFSSGHCFRDGIMKLFVSSPEIYHIQYNTFFRGGCSLESEALFTPRHFIRHFARHLKRVRLPSSCVLSLVPGIDRIIPYHPVGQGSFLMHSSYSIFSVQSEFVLIFGGVGAPAAVISLEIIRELGVKELIVLGVCGLLDDSIKTGSLLVPDTFISEEGTSGLYRTSEETAGQNPQLVRHIHDLLNTHKMPFYQGAHWSTDAPFRETGQKVDRYRKAGCLSVDMEASALLAAARFHRIPAAVLLIGSDHLGRSSWSPPLPSFLRIRKTIRKLFGFLPEVFKPG